MITADSLVEDSIPPMNATHATVNVHSLDGRYIMGGLFSSVEKLIEALKSVEPMLAPSQEQMIEMLWNEHSQFGIPEYAGNLRVSISFPRVE